MEANFSISLGLRCTLWEHINFRSNPFDLSPRDPVPTSQPGKAWVKPEWNWCINSWLSNIHPWSLQSVSCGACLYSAAIALNSALVTQQPMLTLVRLIFQYPMAWMHLGMVRRAAAGISQYVNVVPRYHMGGSKLLDFGFANTGVNDPMQTRD